jgi:hypothetical protein
MEISNRLCYALAVVVFALGLAVACTGQPTPQPKLNAQPASAAAGVPADTLVGVVPAGPGREPPSTTSAVKSDMSKAEQSSAMPMPRQANDDSTPVPPASKKMASSIH